jgi:peptidoglycan hydrolase CwlO-like protein
MHNRSILISLIISIISIVVSITSIYVSIHLFQSSNNDVTITSRFENIEKHNLLLENKVDSLETIVNRLYNKDDEISNKIDSIENITTINYKTIIKWRKSSQIMFP